VSDWRTMPLAEVLLEARPGFACGDDVPDGVFQFRMNNITTDGQIDLTKRRRVPRDIRNLDTFLVQPGDVLFNATNSPDLVGKAAHFSGIDEPAVFSNHFLRLRPQATHLGGPFLARWLNLQFQRGQFRAMCRQWVNQATVSRDALLALHIPLPPMRHQRRIAEVLDRAEALRVRRRAALAQLDTLTQAIFLDMFGDPAANPKRFPNSTIGDASELVTDGEHLTPKRATAGIKLLSARNIRDGYIDFDNVDYIGAEEFERIKKRCNPSLGDVLISCSGTIGRVASVETVEPFSLVRSAALVRSKGSVVRSKFLEHYLRTPALKARMLRRANASSQANLFQGQIRELPVYVPPLVLQDIFAGRAAAVEKLRATHRTALAELDALFASLQHRAFRGEL
jgi:type I restriction enzyme, S subunit